MGHGYPPPTLGYRLTAPDAVARLTDVGARLRSPVVEVKDIAALGTPDRVRFAAIVHDLHPWGRQGVETVEALRRRAPGLPILAYYPDSPAATDAAVRVSAMDLVTSKMQMQDAREPDRLRRLLSSYLQRHPVTRFRQRLAPLLTQVPPGPGRRFLDEAACAVAAGWTRRPKIEELADVSGCSRRQLERIVAESGLPSPRRLVDLLVLLWVRWAVAGDERFGEQEAWHLGLTHRDLLRLEGRMCGRDGGPALAGLADELVRLVSLQNG